jgi:hypothetical protein
MFLLVIAGVAAVVAGGVAIWFGIPVKEFSFGNTMILAGAIAICGGLLLIGLGLVIRELKAIKHGLRERALEADSHDMGGPMLPAGSIAGRRGRRDRDEFDVRHVASESLAPAGPRRQTTPQPDDGDTSGQDARSPEAESSKSKPEVAPQSPQVKGRRNLLFSSSRKERDKGQSGLSERAVDIPSTDRAAEVEPEARSEPHPSFTNTWPRAERSPDLDLTASRRDATLASPRQADRISSPGQSMSVATVVKSGTVDGMAYSLYSDGSIEAQMPEGMMRFASIEQLRTHIDRTR